MRQARCKYLLNIDIPEQPYAKFQCDIGNDCDCGNCEDFEPEYCIFQKGDPCEYLEDGICSLTDEGCAPIGRSEDD